MLYRRTINLLIIHATLNISQLFISLLNNGPNILLAWPFCIYLTSNITEAT